MWQSSSVASSSVASSPVASSSVACMSCLSIDPISFLKMICENLISKMMLSFWFTFENNWHQRRGSAAFWWNCWTQPASNDGFASLEFTLKTGRYGTIMFFSGGSGGVGELINRGRIRTQGASPSIRPPLKSWIGKIGRGWQTRQSLHKFVKLPKVTTSE